MHVQSVGDLIIDDPRGVSNFNTHFQNFKSLHSVMAIVGQNLYPLALIIQAFAFNGK